MRQSFTIYGTLDGLNEYTRACRSHRMSGARMKQGNEEVVRWALKGARLKPYARPVAVRITWVEGMRPGRSRFVPRDKDNIRFAAKFILDAMQAEGVIPSDSWGAVDSITDVFRLNRSDPKIIVEVDDEI